MGSRSASYSSNCIGIHVLDARWAGGLRGVLRRRRCCCRTAALPVFVITNLPPAFVCVVIQVYYWDSFWVIKGLLASNLTNLAEVGGRGGGGLMCVHALSAA